MRLVRVAGGIVWRDTPAGPRIALVHRRRRDDWSLPKGRLEGGERWQDAARREIEEETGCEVRLERFAGAKLFVDRPEPKLVLYWHARVVRERGVDGGEVDEVAWVSRREALGRLDHASDRRLLLRAMGALRRARGGRAPRRSPVTLRDLVVVDSPAAEEAVPSVVADVWRILAQDARRGRPARRLG
ncbi:MAG TPA: NUDIX domain-containing protein [Anaeromyxobacteraceae bacterium]|nr:NUDIX domain-containing protein [Anaeromyxobacteraceae bacterium]